MRPQAQTIRGYLKQRLVGVKIIAANHRLRDRRAGLQNRDAGNFFERFAEHLAAMFLQFGLRQYFKRLAGLAEIVLVFVRVDLHRAELNRIGFQVKVQLEIHFADNNGAAGFLVAEQAANQRITSGSKAGDVEISQFVGDVAALDFENENVGAGQRRFVFLVKNAAVNTDWGGAIFGSHAAD